MSYDIVVIGSGPNGMAAAIELARKGLNVHVIEGAGSVGGGTRTGELTLPGFKHDFCSAVHPMGVLSPYFKKLPLEKYGLKWLFPEVSVAHPLDNGSAVLLEKSINKTAYGLGVDGKAYSKLITPFVKRADDLLEDSLSPLKVPAHPGLMFNFGLKAIRSAQSFAESLYKNEAAKALFAGCAGHSILPLSKPLSAAVGLLFQITAHVSDWPVALGGSIGISQALSKYFKALGGTIETDSWISSMKDLPSARAYVFDTDPYQLSEIAGDDLPEGFKKQLKRYRFGPAAFKIDWALDGAIPWKDSNCLKASTVHIGGTLSEISQSENDAWYGKVNKKPFVLLCQQSQFDTTRAPEGKHTGYAYCHVPNGSTEDYTEYIEAQVERFAPGFKGIILDKKSTFPTDFQVYNPNYFGGAITGGAADLFQLFTRPTFRLNPYSTPNKKIFICSASTPPGGGVHGMCGFYAAKTVLKKIFRSHV